MTSEDRRKASVDLTLHYFNSYYSSWRLAKVLSNKKILDNRYNFFSDIAPEVRTLDKSGEDATIAQEIQHGLYFDSIAQCVQYVEDLFAFIEAAKKPEYFIRNVVTYKAGRITDAIKGFKPTVKNVAEAMHIPTGLDISTASDKDQYDRGLGNLVDLMSDLKKFYADYWFVYNQYKHGLAVPMRPFGTQITEENLRKDKAGEGLTPIISAYDNFNIAAASSKGTFSTNQGLVMPGFSDVVRKNIPYLHNENNYLRLVFPGDTAEINYESFVNAAYKTRICINLFIANYSQKLVPEEGCERFQLPVNYKEQKVMLFTYHYPDKKA